MFGSGKGKESLYNSWEKRVEEAVRREVSMRPLLQSPHADYMFNSHAVSVCYYAYSEKTSVDVVRYINTYFKLDPFKYRENPSRAALEREMRESFELALARLRQQVSAALDRIVAEGTGGFPTQFDVKTRVEEGLTCGL